MPRNSQPAPAKVQTHTGTGLPYLLDDHSGEIVFGKPVYDKAGIIGQLDAGVEIVTDRNDVITYAFADAQNATGFFAQWDEGAGYSTFSAAQREAAREAIEYWDDLIAPSFVEVNGTGGADIVYANTSTGPDQAWAYYPNGQGTPYFKHVASDVWIATPEVIRRTASSATASTGSTRSSTRRGTRSGSAIRAITISATTMTATASPIRSPIRATHSTRRTAANIRSCPISTRTRPGRRKASSTGR